MFQPTSALRPFSPKEIQIIQNQLATRNMTEGADLTIALLIATQIQEQLGIYRTPDSILNFVNRDHQIKSRISNGSDVKVNNFISIFDNNKNVQNGSSFELKIPSMFKQFAELPLNPKFNSFDDFEKIKPNHNNLPSSKRKIRPTDKTLLIESRNIEDIVQEIDIKTNDCHTIFEKKFKKNNKDSTNSIIQDNCLWIYHEYFYCNFDKVFFKQDYSMAKIISGLQFNAEKMKFKDHKLIQKILPLPKLFNLEFIYSQMDRLNEFRCQARMMPKNKNRNDDLELSVNKDIIALHPGCGHLHNGTILAIYKENQYMVKFTKPELGTQKVLDINMVCKNVASPHRSIVENIDLETMCLAIRLLEYKQELMRKLKDLNLKAEKLKANEEVFQNNFLQEYGWVGSTINILSMGLRHIMGKFRMRGLSSLNQQKVGKHLGSILLNPLNLMEKELEKSEENSDAVASDQIKKIVRDHQEMNIEQSVSHLINKNSQSLRNCEWEPEKRNQIEQILRVSVGLLVNLKKEGKSFNVDSNKYVNELIRLTDSNYPEHFNEIYETLNSITAKLVEGK